MLQVFPHFDLHQTSLIFGWLIEAVRDCPISLPRQAGVQAKLPDKEVEVSP